MRITVHHFKESGKSYSSKVSEVKPEHAVLWPWDFMNLVHSNSGQVACYSDIQGGFTRDMYHTIEVSDSDHPDYNLKLFTCLVPIVPVPVAFWPDVMMR